MKSHINIFFRIPFSLFFLFIIFNSFFCNIKPLVVLPFNIKIKNEEADEFFSKYISTKFEIGEPPQNIDAEINFQESDFQLTYTRKYMPFSYNKSKSITYKNTTLYRITTNNFIAGCKANETFYFFTDENIKIKQKFENIPFFMATNADKLFNAILGFELTGMGMRGFVSSLKYAKAINSYTWTLKFKSLDEGLLIIGEEPHFYNQSYDENKLKYTKIYITKTFLSWSISFSSIIIGELIDKNHLIGIISPDILGFIAPEEYFEYLNKLFFNKYYNEKICQKIEIFEKNISNNEYYNEQKIIYYKIECKRNKFTINDINIFPKLQFKNIPLNFSFAFNGIDLFKEEEEKYVFQIYISDIKYWYIGRKFLYKYQLIFNEDNKLIGFYTGMKNSINKEKNNTFKIILILFFSFCFLFLIFIIFKKFRFLNKNKNYAKELEEDFRYKKNESNNISEFKSMKNNENKLLDKND